MAVALQEIHDDPPHRFIDTLPDDVASLTVVFATPPIALAQATSNEVDQLKNLIQITNPAGDL